jgi:hypothetical protein
LQSSFSPCPLFDFDGGFLQMQFSFHLFILLFGFVIGNLFPTFFGDFLGKVGTPLFLFLSLDFFNYFYYSNQRRWKIGKTKMSENPQASPTENRGDQRMLSPLKRGAKSFKRNSFTKKSKQSPFLYSFSARANSFKIGFLFGLFVDAFKVGS